MEASHLRRDFDGLTLDLFDGVEMGPQNLIAEQKLRTQRILGQLLNTREKLNGSRGTGSNQYRKVESESLTPPLKEIGITKNESSTFQQIASIPEEKFEKFIQEKKEEGELTTAGAVRLAKNVHVSNIPETWDEEIRELEQFFSEASLPAGPFRVNEWSVITSLPDFIEGHLTAVKARNGNPTFRPYLNRLQDLKTLLKSVGVCSTGITSVTQSDVKIYSMKDTDRERHLSNLHTISNTI